MRQRILFFGLIGLLTLGIVGCSNRPGRIVPPEIDPAQAGTDAVKAYDTNGNGMIDGAELDKASALNAAIDAIDKNGDKSISAEEITQRVQAWQESRIGIMSVVAKLTLDGQPLTGAEVTLQPESFLGPAVKPAKGTSAEGGMVMLTVDDPELAAQRITGVAPGFYRVIVTGGKGKTAPSKYGDANSPLGIEVAQDASWAQQQLTLDLKSK
jgi:hypothetical protein